MGGSGLPQSFVVTHFSSPCGRFVAARGNVTWLYRSRQETLIPFHKQHQFLSNSSKVAHLTSCGLFSVISLRLNFDQDADVSFSEGPRLCPEIVELTSSISLEKNVLRSLTNLQERLLIEQIRNYSELFQTG